MMSQAPLVMIRPGRVSFEQNLDGLLNDLARSLGISTDDVVRTLDNRDTAGSIFNETSRYGVAASDLKAIDAAIAEKRKGTVQNYEMSDSKRIRYFEFQPAYADYISVVSTLSSRLYSRMAGKASGFTNVSSNSTGTNYGGFYTFWADNATSVSESAGADVQPTALEGIVKGVSNISRQGQFFLGTQYSNSETQKGAFDKAMSEISSVIGGSSADNISGIRASLGDAILGMNPMFPEIWKDSSFSRSYSLSFKFHSPYGHPAAVYQNVLLPFTMLLSLVMPVLRNPSTYSEPFVFQLDCPGYFACDLGICTDFSFVKGGSENLWTVDGLPRQIDVTMTVKDLYPVMAASHNNRSMFFNVGMGTFLDNLAAVTLFQSNASQADIISRLHSNITSALQQGAAIPDRAAAKLQILSENVGFSGLVRAFQR